MVRIGWSINHSSTQLGEWSLTYLNAKESLGRDWKRSGLVSGEEPFSFGYGGTGKKSENCKFADFGERFGENDVIGCYIVSSINCVSVYSPVMYKLYLVLGYVLH